jgi:DNA-binding XRE family transcriptional regulator
VYDSTRRTVKPTVIASPRSNPAIGLLLPGNNADEFIATIPAYNKYNIINYLQPFYGRLPVRVCGLSGTSMKDKNQEDVQRKFNSPILLRLRQIRRNQGISQRGLAEDVGVSRFRLNRLERGRGKAKPEELERLARLLGCGLEVD